jgi:glycosyltransferase involved in cell wall biosynthesis
VKSPLVSVVTPSYNQGHFIRATIESVLSQDYPHIEYIIMDGGSTDETAAVASEYSSRLTWITEKDRGQSHAINKGFRMAKGEVASWLNSDDTIQPGAVAHAVRAFERNPALGAVYGEGYRMDIDGNTTGRFPATETFNLWKLIYLSDYILQQTVYFRRNIFDDIGYLNEDLHWGMDWDILIRIGKAFPIEYIPEYMGSIREYAAAKSFAGGAKRFRELARLMRHHGGIRYPPGYITYGLDTYIGIWTEWIQKHTPRFLNWPSLRLQEFLRMLTFHIIVHELRTTQGLYSDGWAGPKFKYMLGPGSGSVVIEGCVPNVGASLEKQELRIACNGARVASFRVPCGDFHFAFDLPAGCRQRTCSFEVRATRSFIPRLKGMSNDFRRLAFMLKSFGWAYPLTNDPTNLWPL